MIVIEDLDHIGGKSIGHSIKLWSDKAPCTAQIKGGTTWLQHELLVVTSNYTMYQVFGPDTDKQTAKSQIKDTILVDAIASRFRVITLRKRDAKRPVSLMVAKVFGEEEKKLEE